eukprot:2774163-Pleurochrysis_carterae.AAC.3
MPQAPTTTAGCEAGGASQDLLRPVFLPAQPHGEIWRGAEGSALTTYDSTQFAMASCALLRFDSLH